MTESSTMAMQLSEEKHASVSDSEDDEDIPVGTKFGGLRDSMAPRREYNSRKNHEQSKMLLPEDSTTSMTHNDSSSRSGSDKHVNFDRVSEREFRMTLGRHPEAKGTPLELSWSFRENGRSITLEEHEQQRQTSGQGLRRMAKNRREEIALRNHSRESVKLVQEELKEIRQSREKGKNEDIETELAKESKQSQPKKKGLMGKLFKRNKGKK